jgi:hypothetical protein
MFLSLQPLQNCPGEEGDCKSRLAARHNQSPINPKSNPNSQIHRYSYDSKQCKSSPDKLQAPRVLNLRDKVTPPDPYPIAFYMVFQSLRLVLHVGGGKILIQCLSGRGARNTEQGTRNKEQGARVKDEGPLFKFSSKSRDSVAQPLLTDSQTLLMSAVFG